MYLHETENRNKPTVIFLHGIGSSGFMWQKHFEAMRNDYHCLAPDLPGHGKSNLERWSTIERVGAEIAEIIKQHGNGKAHVVGLSLGGSLSLYLLARFPNLILSAVIDGASATPISGAFFIKVGVCCIAPFLHTKTVIRGLSQMIHIKNSEMENFTKDMLATNRMSFIKAFTQANSKLKLGGIEQSNHRVLFLSGEREKAISASNTRLAKLMPDAKCVVIPNANHGWLAEMPDLHVQFVRSWLKGETLPSVGI
jgi:pimeloyl-ACP methyl ester carboxylesterase